MSVLMERRPTRLYLAGPMRGIDRHNAPAFDAGAVQLREAGFEVFNPVEHTRSLGIQFDQLVASVADDLVEGRIRSFLLDDITWILEHADGIALLPGWQNSAGALAEVAVAKAVRMPVATITHWLAPVEESAS
jgi:Domain of unknown function (DUF4406)